MLFSYKKRIQRDRDAGLVFCWRAGQEGNRGGMLIAVLMASGLFALAFWGISLDLKASKPESRQAAKILLLDTISPEMALWIDQHSPFPSRWDPQFDDAHAARVQSDLAGLYQEISVPPSPWREMPDVGEEEVASPRLIIDGEVDLGGLPDVKEREKKPVVLELTLTITAFGELENRIPRELVPFSMKIPQQAYGSTQRFALTLREDGNVVTCTPLEWSNDDFSMELENWVRLQSYLPAKGEGLVLGEVSVNVEVMAHVRD